MRHVTITEEYQEFAALYALGALSQHEARAFEEHLRGGCTVCETEVAEFDKVVAALGYAEAEAQTPTYLRDILMGRIEREAKTKGPEQGAAVVQLSERRAARKEAAAARVAAAPAYSVIPWAIAASFAIFSIIAFVAWRQVDRNADEMREQLAAVKVELSHLTGGSQPPADQPLQEQLAAAAKRAEHQAQEIEELTQIVDALSTEGTQVIPLAGQQGAPSASGRLYWDTQHNKWIVRADLPRLPEGKVYQLWFVTAANEKVSAGLLKTDDSGHAFAVVPVR
ncbi:MAG TPA: anti-sigma factor, partial [Blastocatellia bacterium]|nr:anti-sigma factor [Blastocatellia bacterium]